MIECYHCGTEFEVKFEDSDAEVYYCPSCGADIEGEEVQLELDFSED